MDGQVLKHDAFRVYLGVTLDRTLSYRQHLQKTAAKVKTRNNLLSKLAGSSWGANADTIHTSALALLFGSRVLLSSLVQICSHRSSWQAAEQLYAIDFWHSMHYTVAVASSSHQHTTTQHTAKSRMRQVAANCWKSPWMASVPGLLQPPCTSESWFDLTCLQLTLHTNNKPIVLWVQWKVSQALTCM